MEVLELDAALSLSKGDWRATRLAAWFDKLTTRVEGRRWIEDSSLREIPG
jgi:hypothetical protein